MNFLVLVAEKYGLGIANLVLLLYIAYKFATNHLRHLSLKIGDLIKQQNSMDKKIDSLGERIAKVEGKLDI